MANEEVGEGEEQKKKSPLLLFIILAVVLVAGSIGGTVLMMSGGGEEELAEEELEPAAIYYAINPKFQTNYDVNGRPRLFQLAVSLVTREDDVVEALSTHLPTIKSRLVILLSGQKFETLQTPEGREQLREQSLAAVQEILNTEIGKPGVERVLFTDFVMQ
ncbi:MAG: flagellar basal body-associated FliL family protein [Gammaproteobacteria bacterium]|nr:flagellar basal body-associated FliL family protein [Gammaproteobacteria bacterium]MBT8150973.1 flagellar basal body-associated FliL family protein [Gammaproteobacteria bacterium]NND39837.1 flagellar basal body-associated protein FliL [Pseudomonadales bacterium]NNL10250.1 flagellar basal body-associated protein FliL [Pseudomonadales bacterium]NNM11157.1 flagellar basal body-associated protein FliL [Pseudomonadales bacterium]